MSSPSSVTPIEAQAVRELAAAYHKMTEQIGKVIVGQKQVVEQLLMAMFSRGHCLLVGVPGLAKTLLVSTVSKILHLSFKRIQFTPDLMPADITGTDILQDDPETGRRKFVFLPGPIFAHMILAEELQIMKQTTSTYKPELKPILQGEQILRLQEVVRQVVVADHVFAYAADLVRATRPRETAAPKFITDLVAWGAGPRASQFLILGGKARAILHGRMHVTTDDIREVAHPVLRHRLVTTFNADAEGITTDEVINRLIKAVPLPQA